MRRAYKDFVPMVYGDPLIIKIINADVIENKMEQERPTKNIRNATVAWWNGTAMFLKIKSGQMHIEHWEKKNDR